MDRDALFKQLLDEVATLVKDRAHPRRTIPLHPAVAELIDRVPATGTGAGDPAAPPPPETAAATVGLEAPATAPGDREAALAELRDVVSACTRCHLHETRTQTVFGEGNPHADVVFVGEAPGANEDRQGRPFVGRAGQLLTDIIEKGMRIRRSDVFICNVLKCRPPNNNDPTAAEKAQCLPYLHRQLALIRPKVICALGAHAARSLLDTEESTGRLRGKWHLYGGIPLRVTYHPAWVLRQDGSAAELREAKAKVWADIQHVMAVMNDAVRLTPADITGIQRDAPVD
jgi:DNA polymerase